MTFYISTFITEVVSCSLIGDRCLPHKRTIRPNSFVHMTNCSTSSLLTLSLHINYLRQSPLANFLFDFWSAWLVLNPFSLPGSAVPTMTFFFLIFIVIQLQLCAFSPRPSTPPQNGDNFCILLTNMKPQDVACSTHGTQLASRGVRIWTWPLWFHSLCFDPSQLPYILITVHYLTSTQEGCKTIMHWFIFSFFW